MREGTTITADESVSMPGTGQHAVNPDALNELIGQVIADASGPLRRIAAMEGDRTGIRSVRVASDRSSAARLQRPL
jgi:hypothetical protein